MSQLRSTNGTRPRLLHISPILPWPAYKGQQMRVYNKLRAFRELFDVTFLSLASPAQEAAVSTELASLADRVILLPWLSRQSPRTRLTSAVRNHMRALRTGLRVSNHLIGDIELSKRRLARHCRPADYDLVLYEYWHAHASTAHFQAAGVPCVLDMHDLLWRVVDRQMRRWPLPAGWRRRRVARYRAQEEAAWSTFTGLITINEDETAYVRQHQPDKPFWYTPMGIDLAAWPYSWQPVMPPRFAFYGALGNRGNQAVARRCLESIMPKIWTQRPDAELWLVGSNPPPFMQRWAENERVFVTGYVANVGETLAGMTALLCPWQGQFGFRSRVIEALAIGVPVVATADAVQGMGLQPNAGLLLGEDDDALGEQCHRLLVDPEFAGRQSRLGRDQATHFSFAATYGALAQALADFARHAQRI